MTKTALVVLFAFLLLVPMAAGHAAERREFEARLLDDCVDDVGGHDAPEFGYDLVSLDVYEIWDGAANQAVFRLTLQGNNAADITYTAAVGGEERVFGWQTDDGETWTGTGFDSVAAKLDVYVDGREENGRDGDRFALEGTISVASLGGLSVVVADHEVNSDAPGVGVDDDMPGLNGVATSCNQPFGPADYSLRGPTRYVGLDMPDDAASAPDETNFVDVEVENLLQKEAQVATLDIIRRTGSATVQFHDVSASNSDGYSDTVTLNLGQRGTAGSKPIVHLAITGPSGASGVVDVEVVTDLGGRVVKTIAYEVGTLIEDPEPAGPPPEQSKESPGPAAALGMLALMGAAAWRRR